MTTTTNQITFKDLLASFLDAVDNTASRGQDLAMLALTHYVEHGNLSQLQSIYDELGKKGRKNLINRNGLIKWAVKHGNIKMVGDTLRKDVNRPLVSEDNTNLINGVDLVAAAAEMWWDAAPLAVIKDWGIDDFEKSVLKAIDAYTNEKKYSPGTTESNVVRLRTKGVVEALFADIAKERLAKAETVAPVTTTPEVASDEAVKALANKVNEDKPTLSIPAAAAAAV
jgi:hypothetical protein